MDLHKVSKKMGVVLGREGVLGCKCCKGIKIYNYINYYSFYNYILLDYTAVLKCLFLTTCEIKMQIRRKQKRRRKRTR